MAEEWKPIPGYEGLYDASNLGRIRSHPGKTTHTELRGNRHWKERVLRAKLGRGNGKKRADYRVDLWKDGKPKTFLVSRLIAMAWHGVPQTKMTVNHINGNQLDNRKDNLEWLTLSDNIKHGVNNGAFNKNRKNIAIIGEDKSELYFPSISSAMRFLGRSTGYLYGVISRGKSVLESKSGEKYTIKEVLPYE